MYFGRDMQSTYVHFYYRGQVESSISCILSGTGWSYWQCFVCAEVLSCLGPGNALSDFCHIRFIPVAGSPT